VTKWDGNLKLPITVILEVDDHTPHIVGPNFKDCRGVRNNLCIALTRAL